MKPTKRTLGIKWKFFGYMMLFLVLLLALLWLFQVVFFGEIYKSVRISEIKRSADALCDSVDEGDSELRSLAIQTALEKQVCVLIFDASGNIIATEEMLSDCIIHSMSARNVYTLYTIAQRAGGEELSRFYLDAFRNIRPVTDFSSPAELPDDIESSSTETIIYTKIVPSKMRENDIVIMLNASISPVASTVRTLMTELVIISVIMTLLAVLLSFVLARRVSHPIVRVSDSAKKLARGNYDADFTADDYREIAELSDTLSYAAAELSKTEAFQRELIANISHDLRTPLTMITGYAEVMRDIPDENTPENVQIIIDEAQRLTSLVNDVLDISKLQSGTQELDITEFNITDTVRKVIGRFARLTEQDGYKIEFVNDCEVMVNADRTRILQVIYNFVNNAITHAGGDKYVRVSQHVMRRESGKTDVRIEVTDHGEGIPAEALPYIWDRYYKVDKHHRRAQTGSGLGLSIVKHILELHGARYGADSREGIGSTFWFEL